MLSLVHRPESAAHPMTFLRGKSGDRNRVVKRYRPRQSPNDMPGMAQLWWFTMPRAPRKPGTWWRAFKPEGGQTMAMQADMTRKQFGRLDILINSAGSFGRNCCLPSLD
ncbi:MAG: hypothetical protein ICV75_03320 [Nitrospiraceae bacterium]|nr:hypothetical protein [Nitrospiraceae bacterium]